MVGWTDRGATGEPCPVRAARTALDRSCAQTIEIVAALAWRSAFFREVWDEEQHPRGKTSPESTPGSFATPEFTRERAKGLRLVVEAQAPANDVGEKDKADEPTPCGPEADGSWILDTTLRAPLFTPRTWRETFREVWDAEQHPRGKTTPGTNEGSFAPASGAGEGSERADGILAGFAARRHRNAASLTNRYKQQIRDNDNPVAGLRQRMAQAYLRELPLTHATSYEGAVSIYREGLKSHAAVVTEARALLAEIRAKGVRDDQEDQVDALEDELRSGATHPGDEDLGLDRFAFLSFGRPYRLNNILVCIDQAILDDDEVFATPDDIVNYASESEAADAQEPGGKYSAKTIAAYQHEMVSGRTTLVELAALRLAAISRRTRPEVADVADPAQLMDTLRAWEVKTPYVQPSRIKGILLGESDAVQELQDAGIPRKSIYTIPKGLWTDANISVARTALLRRIQTGAPVAMPTLPDPKAIRDPGALDRLRQQLGESR